MHLARGHAARAERVLLDSGFVQGADATTHVSDLLPDHAGWVRRQCRRSERRPHCPTPGFGKACAGVGAAPCGRAAGACHGTPCLRACLHAANAAVRKPDCRSFGGGYHDLCHSGGHCSAEAALVLQCGSSSRRSGRAGPHGHRGNSDCLRFGLPLPGNASKMALKTSGVCSRSTARLDSGQEYHSPSAHVHVCSCDLSNCGER
mmetsp:Transcript_29334/g.69189  ORF Transcript_29334/g.69189 Transcript_29334/m.69189 type:complete len:204 (+) Transcript_29334:411-1022(+)